ncbi:MAG: aspartate/glutamate racemase family protein [Phycisphaerales bacterium]
MTKHIGIAAVSPEGAAVCYRDIFRRASTLIGTEGHPVVSVYTEPLDKYIQALMRDDWHTIGGLLRHSAEQLARAGAEFCITPDNVIQHAIHLAEVGSPIPWLTMTDLVADRICADGRKTVGVIGTKLVMFGSTYQTTLGIRGVKVIAPDARDAEAIDAIIFRELIRGEIVDASRTRMIEAINRLADRGAEGVVLGCSEGPLLVNQSVSTLPLYDSVALLADGAVRRAMAEGATV